MQKLKVFLLLGFLFIVCFFATTALLDWVCWQTGYYDKAVQEAMVMD